MIDRPENAVSSVEAKKLRILAISELWQGANDYAFVRAFRRAGHSVQTVSGTNFVPAWRSRSLKMARKILKPSFIQEFNSEVLAAAKRMRPDLFFVFKGHYLTASTIKSIQSDGAVAIQFYPDTGFQTHGAEVIDALLSYDWFFSTKASHPEYFKQKFNLNKCSFLPHCFDPEVHFPQLMSHDDLVEYSCDISFIGNTSKKKASLVKKICHEFRDKSVKVWGPQTWERVNLPNPTVYQGHKVLGLEYAKAIACSKINLGLLFEGDRDAPGGDTTTARTFEIPAAGGFMIHERNSEVMELFSEDKDCVFFEGFEDLCTKIRYYLEQDDLRARISAAGRKRCVQAGYSVDSRAQEILLKFDYLNKRKGSNP